MKRSLIFSLVFVFVTVLACATFHVGAQQPATKQAHADAPALSDKAKLEIRDEQLAGTRIIAEFQNLQSTIEKAQKRQEDLKLAFTASDKKLQSLVKDVCGDQKLWVLDIDALQCKPAPQPSPTPKAN